MTRYRTLACTATLVSLAVASCSSDPVGSSSPVILKNRITFTNFRSEGGFGLYHVGLDGGDPVPLLADAAAHGSCARISPDGRRIVTSHASLFIVDADGSNPRDLTASIANPGYYWSCASWSPDGSRLTATRRKPSPKSPGSSELYVLRADGSELTKLADGDAFYTAEWSPQGDQIMYTSSNYTDGGPYNFAHTVINPDGTAPRRTQQVWSWAKWSPDGHRIAYMCGTTGSSRLCVGTPQGPGVPITEPLVFNTEFDWAPNSELIAFACPTGICVIESDGTNRRTLIPGTFFSPIWSADGTLLVFRSQPGQLFIASADGTGMRLLVSLPGWNENAQFSPVR